MKGFAGKQLRIDLYIKKKWYKVVAEISGEQPWSKS